MINPFLCSFTHSITSDYYHLVAIHKFKKKKSFITSGYELSHKFQPHPLINKHPAHMCIL